MTAPRTDPKQDALAAALHDLYVSGPPYDGCDHGPDEYGNDWTPRCVEDAARLTSSGWTVAPVEPAPAPLRESISAEYIARAALDLLDALHEFRVHPTESGRTRVLLLEGTVTRIARAALIEEAES